MTFGKSYLLMEELVHHKKFVLNTDVTFKYNTEFYQTTKPQVPNCEGSDQYSGNIMDINHTEVTSTWTTN